MEVIDQLMRAVMAGSSSGVSALSRRREKEEEHTPGRQQLVSLVSLLLCLRDLSLRRVLQKVQIPSFRGD